VPDFRAPETRNPAPRQAWQLPVPKEALRMKHQNRAIARQRAHALRQPPVNRPPRPDNPDACHLRGNVTLPKLLAQLERLFLKMETAFGVRGWPLQPIVTNQFQLIGIQNRMSLLSGTIDGKQAR
jgi:hypothetical protein